MKIIEHMENQLEIINMSIQIIDISIDIIENQWKSMTINENH